MLRSVLELRGRDPGFAPAGVLTFRAGWPVDMARPDPTAPARFFAEVQRRLAALPGVESVAFTNWLPGRSGRGYVGALHRSDRPPARPQDATVVQRRSASPGLFHTLRIPLLAGRTFDDTLDHPDSLPVLVVDERFARRHFGSAAAAVGAHVTEYHETMRAHGSPVTLRIVGVVGNIRHNLDQEDDVPTAYTSHRQWPEYFQSALLRTRGDPAAIVPLVRDTVLAVNREIPIYDVFTLEEVLLRSDTVWPRRFFGFLFTLFGAVALFLACIGIHGVMSYHVSQRVQELGIRIALGAPPRAIVRLIVRQGLRLVAVGLLVGIAASLALANLLGGLLYGVSPHDPPTFAAVPLLLAAVALFACWLSSRRATLIAPHAALRAT
jgi:predicted permease